MGKKTKTGKQRKDKFYHLAKETGYRSRAAFKLIQLNRKFGFLQKSRVCIDLCAAPGGWMQVAHQNMPLSSIVIGVDLFPIKPVSGCISINEDITSDKCKAAISKEIQTWKADVVLHDGAPNVGLNWLHDAYQQAVLTLSALKLGTQFLREGGWFITKVFRSKDYNALIWVLKQLFKKVHATKPQASRNESSEIFVVCQGFIAPDNIDPKFLDPKYVFEDFQLQSKSNLKFLHPEKQKKAKPEGYEDGDYTQHHSMTISEIIDKEEPIEVLKNCSEIILDDKEIKSHPSTTVEIKECCKDIKVLGRKDIKSLLYWIKHMKEMKTHKPTKEEDFNIALKNNIADEVTDEVEQDNLDDKLAEIQDEEHKQSRRKRKQLNKQRRKLAEKMNLKMVLKGDEGPTLQNEDMFKLSNIKSAKQLENLIDVTPDIVIDQEGDSDDEFRIKPKYMKYDVESSKLDSTGTYYKDSDSELEMEADSEDNVDKEDLGFSDSEENEKPTKKTKSLKSVKSSNPLLTDLDYRDVKTKRDMKAELWFQKESFKDIDSSEDEDADLDKLAEGYNKKGKKIYEPVKSKVNNSEENELESEDSDYDDGELLKKTKTLENKSGKGLGADSKVTKVDNQEEQELKKLKKRLNMNEETLALGTLLATSRKAKRDIIDDGWNRYMFEDDHLPDWFVQDEENNMKKPVPVPEHLVEEYKNKLKEINVRPIKKVIEAKARKKKRTIKKMERAKKKIENIMENSDMSEREKSNQVKQLLKKAKPDQKKDVTYVVAKKHSTGKRASRPAGVKGRYKVVDPRMKKDMRATRAKEKKSKGSNKRKTNFKRKSRKAK